jgi:hypothetical protein
MPVARGWRTRKTPSTSRRAPCSARARTPLGRCLHPYVHLLDAACQLLSTAGSDSILEADCALLWPFVASLAGKCSQVKSPRVASTIARTFDLESSAVMMVNHEVGGRAQARHAHAESQRGACCGVGV